MQLPFLTRRRANADARAVADNVRPVMAAASTAAAVPEAKASRTASLIALQSAGRPVWTPRDYAALAREGFAKNAVAYRAIRMIAEATASIPWLLYDGAAELTEHPLLALLAKPNRRQAGAEFREALAGHLLVSGNAYVEAVTLPGDGDGAAVRELHTLRPDRMKVVPGGDGWPEAYEYTAGGRTVRFPVVADALPPILHLALFHPLDDHYGFAPIEAAAVALDIHNAAGAWNKALLDNSARPSGALVYSAKDGGNLSAEQYERLKAELSDGFTGAARAGRPLLLEGGLDWRAMSLTPKDMDFMEAKNGAAREIALAFGVPPMLLGIPGDNTYANYKEANAAFWRGTLLPLTARIAGALGAWLTPAFGPGSGSGAGGSRLRLWFDADQVEALSADREALWARVASADFLTVNEKRAAVGYGEVEDAGGIDALAGKAGFDPKQPRVPRGSRGGGQWTDGDATTGAEDAGRRPGSLFGTYNEDQLFDRPILVASNGDWLPDIPRERPSSLSARWTAVKDSVRRLARLGVRASPVGRLIDIVEVGSWLYEYSPYIAAYFDGPRSLDELRADAATPAKGYDIHHLVERTPGLKDGFSSELLDSPENLVRIPTLKHWDLNAWYGRKNERFGGLSPRDYLRGKSWEERLRVGKMGLREVGVLAP